MGDDGYADDANWLESTRRAGVARGWNGQTSPYAADDAADSALTDDVATALSGSRADVLALLSHIRDVANGTTKDLG